MNPNESESEAESDSRGATIDTETETETVTMVFDRQTHGGEFAAYFAADHSAYHGDGVPVYQTSGPYDVAAEHTETFGRHAAWNRPGSDSELASSDPESDDQDGDEAQQFDPENFLATEGGSVADLETALDAMSHADSDLATDRLQALMDAEAAGKARTTAYDAIMSAAHEAGVGDRLSRPDSSDGDD